VFRSITNLKIYERRSSESVLQNVTYAQLAPMLRYQFILFTGADKEKSPTIFETDFKYIAEKLGINSMDATITFLHFSKVST
jgi:hypothetical protein